MDNASDPSFQRLGSSACHVCKGFGDLQNHRGAFVDVPEGQDDRGRYLYMYMHHRSITALVRSAEAGCSICTVLRDEMRNHHRTKFDKATATVSPALITASTHPELESVMNTKQSDDDTSAATQLARLAKTRYPSHYLDLQSWDLGNDDKERIVLEHLSHHKLGPRGTTGKFSVQAYVLNASSVSHQYFCCFQTSCDQFDPDLKHRPSRHLLSDPHIGLIKHWRDTCEKNHAHCRAACGQKLPSRVLELDPNTEDSVCLVETHDIEQETLAYACLTYCWGRSKTQAGQTNKSNLSKSLQGISLNNLPSTVVDTIRLCHKLGIQYLWVDRLCIIQDDEEDWAKESSKMCDIYSGSELTISTPVCSESSQSFLEERLRRWFPEQSKSGSIEFLDEKSNLKKSLWMRLLFQERSPWAFEDDWSSFCALTKDESHWMGRGWTFQEWMLSPRVLHIGSMTIWDCFKGYANELNQRDMEKAYLIRNPREFGKGISWKSVVEEYSKRGIAYEKDRLPALAGLAERFSRNTRKTYLAGLWLEEMPFSLLWQADSAFYNFADRRELANQTMPSWSWAHCNGPVKFFFGLRKWRAKALVTSYRCRYEPPSSISTVVEAWIDIRGALMDVTETRSHGFFSGLACWELFPDDKDWDTDDAVRQGNFRLLLLLSATKTLRDDDVLYAALMLQRCGSNDVSPLCFRRVGIATSRWYETFEKPLWKRQVVRLV